MNVAFIVGLALFPFTALCQAPPTVKQAPPLGIAVSAADSIDLKSRLEKLDLQSQSIRAHQIFPDIEVFQKAVRYALDYHEFFKPAEIQAAKEQLSIAFDRAAALQQNKTPWTSARGSVVRGYRSKIDGSAQPYGLRVPQSWNPEAKQPRPLYLWFHGRNDTLSEVAFIAGELKGKREFAPPEAFELRLYGRYCNASKFAGEMDAFEALDHVIRNYPIDTNRIAVLGFSMGGASTWHIAAHYPGLWAAASAGAGFAETAIYAKVFAPGKDAPPSWEQTLWHWYDATDYAANFANVPMIAYSGEIDPQKQSADIMEEAMAREGLRLERLIGPKTAHKYEPDTRKDLSTRVDALVEKGSDPFPKRIRFVTYTLRYNRMKWISLDRLEKHWTRAEIEAERNDGSVHLKATNIAAFTITLPEMPRQITINGQEVRSPSGRFEQVSGKWQPAQDSRRAHKRPGLTGPIDDAFMDSFIFVRPTGKAWNDRVNTWVQTELERAVVEWRRVFRGDARVKNDTEITPEDIAHHNLVLWGDPGSNQLLSTLLPKIPLTWTRHELALGEKRFAATDHAPILIFPNPLNPARYVVLNSSFTFREGSTTSNSLQTPKLPDWAIVDLRTPPSLKWPGQIVAAGFFDDNWLLTEPVSH